MKGEGSVYRPTKENQNLVEGLASYGISQDRIADLLGIAESTLKKHFAHELRNGVTKVVAKVAESVVKQALAGNQAACQFYLVRFGGPAWQQPKQQIEHSGAVGAYDLSKLSDEELRKFEAFLRKVTVGGGSAQD